ncbi:13493_t:CDS:2, partial [Gigaspora rosea]
QRKISSTSGNNANPLSPSSSSSSTPDNVFVQQEFIDGRSLPNTAVRPKRKHTSNDDSKRRRDVASIDSDFTERDSINGIRDVRKKFEQVRRRLLNWVIAIEPHREDGFHLHPTSRECIMWKNHKVHHKRRSSNNLREFISILESQSVERKAPYVEAHFGDP